MNDDAKYREFEEALTDVLSEKEHILKRRARLATARELVDRTDPRYWEAVERAFAARDQAAKLNSGGEPDVIGW
jgi:hypothetical protein